MSFGPPLSLRRTPSLSCTIILPATHRQAKPTTVSRDAWPKQPSFCKSNCSITSSSARQPKVTPAISASRKQAYYEVTFSRERRLSLGSARVSRVGFGVAPKHSFFVQCLLRKECARKSSRPRGRVRQHARRMRYPKYVAPMTSTKIHPTAIVDPSAKIDASVEIGPFSIIGPQVTIGEKTIVQSHVVIEGQVEIGTGNLIGYGAVIGAPPQDVSFSPERKTKVEIGNNNVIREYCNIHRGT